MKSSWTGNNWHCLTLQENVMKDLLRQMILETLSHTNLRWYRDASTVSESCQISPCVITHFLLNSQSRGRRETEETFCNVDVIYLVLMCLNKAQQGNLKLYFKGRNEKYLPRMEKLTGACSLRGSCVKRFFFPFAAGVFCWAELERPSEATYGEAGPANYALVWQVRSTETVAGLFFWFQWIFIFSKPITDLVKLLSSTWSLSCVTFQIFFEGNSYT